MAEYNKKMLVKNPQDKSGGYKLRIWEYPPRGKRTAYLLIKCGCCQSSVKIYFDNGRIPIPEKTLEINGVFASVKEWRNILLPLLK